MTIEQRITQQLDASLTDAEFDTLSAEADAEAIPFRDAGPLPAAQPAIPLDHDGRGPGVGPRRFYRAELIGTGQILRAELTINADDLEEVELIAQLSAGRADWAAKLTVHSVYETGAV